MCDVLFSHSYGFFQFSLLYGFSFILFWSAKVFYIISVFLNLLISVLGPNMWSFLKNMSCALEKNVCSPVFCVCLLGPCGFSVVQNLCFLTDVLCVCPIQFWKWSTEISYYYFSTVCFCLEFCQSLLYIFRSSKGQCINIYNWYIFLVNYSWYPYIMFFVSCNSCLVKAYFVWHKYSHSYSLLVTICMKLFFHLFTFRLCVSLNLKWAVLWIAYIFNTFSQCMSFDWGV